MKVIDESKKNKFQKEAKSSFNFFHFVEDTVDEIVIFILKFLYTARLIFINKSLFIENFNDNNFNDNNFIDSKIASPYTFLFICTCIFSFLDRIESLNLNTSFSLTPTVVRWFSKTFVNNKFNIEYFIQTIIPTIIVVIISSVIIDKIISYKKRISSNIICKLYCYVVGYSFLAFFLLGSASILFLKLLEYYNININIYLLNLILYLLLAYCILYPTYLILLVIIKLNSKIKKRILIVTALPLFILVTISFLFGIVNSIDPIFKKQPDSRLIALLDNISSSIDKFPIADATLMLVNNMDKPVILKNNDHNNRNLIFLHRYDKKLKKYIAIYGLILFLFPDYLNDNNNNFIILKPNDFIILKSIIDFDKEKAKTSDLDSFAQFKQIDFTNFPGYITMNCVVPGKESNYQQVKIVTLKNHLFASAQKK